MKHAKIKARLDELESSLQSAREELDRLQKFVYSTTTGTSFVDASTVPPDVFWILTHDRVPYSRAAGTSTWWVAPTGRLISAEALVPLGRVTEILKPTPATT